MTRIRHRRIFLGNRTETTDALGNTIYKSYDPLCNVVAEWGATYPVRYTYDTQNRRTSLSTTRSATSNLQPFNLSTFQLAQWDTTTWTYDSHTGNCTSKTYADNSTVTYTYTPDNLLLRTTYASGRWIENVYDSRRQVVGTLSSDGENDSTVQRDAYGRIVSESNAVASAIYSLAAVGMATNETEAVGTNSIFIVRTLDAQDRLIGLSIPAFGYSLGYTYAEDGNIEKISNDIAVVDYSYTPDHLDAGYSLTLSNGVTFTRNLVRDGYRRSLVTDVSSVANGVGVGSLTYTYDALNRPTARNTDTFGYNARSEVTAANVSGVPAAYGYDEIGNSTNWTANCLNQYTQFTHDADGNMTQCGDWTYTYDAANRLKTVSSNGVLLVTNFYDAKSRRVKKITQEATTTFFYDGWNLIEERIAYTNGTTTTIRYYWGKDLSGTLQGAAGVGGLLYLMIDGGPYIPCYDNNGNITRYLDANGNTVAQYTYDAFGNLISQSGPLADFFRHRFSTKYHDSETGLYYFGYRFYFPSLMRWLNRDPIEEGGGVNLYGFCGNDAVSIYDKDGKAYFAKRELDGVGWLRGLSRNSVLDVLDIEVSHEHLFFGTPEDPLDDLGYFDDGGVRNDRNRKKYHYVVTERGYNDCVMRKAVASVTPKPYCIVGFMMGHDNCQSYANLLRNKYHELIRDPNVRCMCFGKKRPPPVFVLR